MGVCVECGTANPPSSSNAKLAFDYCRSCGKTTSFAPAVDRGPPHAEQQQARVSSLAPPPRRLAPTHAWWAFTGLALQIEEAGASWGEFLAPFRAQILGTTGTRQQQQQGGTKKRPALAAAGVRGFAGIVRSVVDCDADGGAPPALLTVELAAEMAAVFMAESARKPEGGVAGGGGGAPGGCAAHAVTATLHRLLDAHGPEAVVRQLKSAAHAHGLSVAARPLQPPRFHIVDWHGGQVFTAAEDPDRTAMPWRQPAFLTEHDPVAQSKQTTVTELTPRLAGLAWTAADAATYGKGPGGFAAAGPASFARVVHNVLTPEQCGQLVESVNHKGFTPALLNIGRGNQKLVPHARDGHRIIVDSSPVAEWLFEVLRPHIPATLPSHTHLGGDAIGMNERCRFLCYTPGQEFAEHCDGAYFRPRGHQREGDVSRVTVQLYLHDVPEAHGGATTFLPDHGCGQPVPCQPVAGSCLLFTQDLYHEGSKVHTGIKYTMRTEVMYGHT